LTCDGEADFHPISGCRQGRPDDEFLIGYGIFQAGKSFEVEQDLPGIEVGVLIAEELEIAFVGFELISPILCHSL